MAWWKPMARLVVGWGMMLAGAVVMLNADWTAPSSRGRTWPAVQAVIGFAVVLAGWWLRRAAMRPPDEPR